MSEKNTQIGDGLSPRLMVVGNLGTYRIPVPTLSKLDYNTDSSLWECPLGEQLKQNDMPIKEQGNMPYIFDFENADMPVPQLRAMLTDYEMDSSTGSSTAWYYDPTGTGFASTYGPITLSPPYNPTSVANITFTDDKNADTNYLLISDWGDQSAGSSGATLDLYSMSNRSDPLIERYRLESSVLVPNKVDSGTTYYSRVQQVTVSGTRIFALAYYINAGQSGYIGSELREYSLSGTTFSPVGNPAALKPNAQKMVPYVNNGTLYFGVVCLGGPQGAGTCNGALSSISLVPVAAPTPGGFGAVVDSYIGGTFEDEQYDYQDMAISATGDVHIVTGNYNTSYAMQYILYRTNFANLLLKSQSAAAPINEDSPAATEVTRGTRGYAYFIRVGYVMGANSTIWVVFFTSTNGTTASQGNDTVEFFLPGQYGSRQVISADNLNGGLTGQGFANNSAAIVTTGGYVPTGGSPIVTVYVSDSALPTVPGAEGKNRRAKLEAFRSYFAK
ncbi:MAG: hypothetical protein LBQ12_02895 [Deltaproteobacteria bacterium]|jgi:hypothetical protein|nr:hypothetical protein [Deltaproteobacteria bacterium]